jgi:hypothetical protein
MAYEELLREDGGIDVRGPHGIVQLLANPNGTWAVVSNQQHRSFDTKGEALDCARQMTGDLRTFKCPAGHDVVNTFEELLGQTGYQCATCSKRYPFNVDDRL